MERKILSLLKLKSANDLKVKEVSFSIKGLEQDTRVPLGEILIVDNILNLARIETHDQRRIFENAKSSFFSLVQTVQRELKKTPDYERKQLLKTVAKYLLSVYLLHHSVCCERVMELFIDQVEVSRILNE